MTDGDARPDAAGYYAFVILLIPAYVTEVTGNAADAGVVMAIIGLAAARFRKCLARTGSSGSKVWVM